MHLSKGDSPNIKSNALFPLRLCVKSFAPLRILASLRGIN
jgi:hypothetical protein